MDNICNHCLHGDLCAKKEHLLEPILECSQYIGKVKVRLVDGCLYDLLINDEWYCGYCCAEDAFRGLSELGIVEFEVDNE